MIVWVVAFYAIIYDILHSAENLIVFDGIGRSGIGLKSYVPKSKSFTVKKN